MEKNYFDELPSIKSTAVQLMQLVLDPEASIKELANLIKYDVGLSAKIIKIANSAKFSPNSNIADIETAIKTLGLNLLKNIVLSITVIDLVEQDAFSEENHILISKYSIATAAAAQYLGTQANFPLQGACYLSGLMLYLSLFFLASKFESAFNQMKQEAIERNIRLSKIIEEKIKLNPFSISYEITKKWHLPDTVSQSIFFQFNTPRDADVDNRQTKTLIYILNAASLATEAFFGTGIKKTNMLSFENQCREIGLQQTDLLKKVYNEIQSQLSALQIEKSSQLDYNRILIDANRELSSMNIKYETLYHELNEKNQQLESLNIKLNGRNKLLKSKIMFDDLTEVFNRRYFETELDKLYSNHQRKSQVICLLLIDLDNFKFINDTFGHQVGDEILKSVAHALRSSVRKEDVVARIGGDEFVIMPFGLKSEEDAAILANTILKKFSKPFVFQNKKILTSVSIGISTLGTKHATPSELLKDADIAMYQAKAKGKNGFFFFNDVLDRESKKRIAIEMSLSKGLERGEFKIVYQPIVRVENQTIHGVEALLRWKRPLIKEIPPNEFIPYLETNGQIHKVGHWVMENVIKQIAQWRRQDLQHMQYHVNISSKQLDNQNFAREIETILNTYQVPSTYLGIELTESALCENSTEVDIILNQLNAMDVICSIDDFGTGYSSLMRLKNLPFQTIKIDRAFISTMFEDIHSKHIVEAIIFLAKRLNLTTVAEGVENEQEYQQLKDWGCDYVQGYYFSKPLTAEDLAIFLKEHD